MRVPTMSDGSRSGVNWMRANDAADDVGERLGGERLGEAGHRLEQAVAAGEQTDEQPLEQAGLADDDLAQLEEDALDVSAVLASSIGAPLFDTATGGWLPWEGNRGFADVELVDVVVAANPAAG